MDSLDLILGAPEGNEPDIDFSGAEVDDHKHLWEVERSALNREPKYEFCLFCKKRRRLVPGEVIAYIPRPVCERTGY